VSVVREIDVAVLRDSVARLIVEANYNIPADILDALRAAIAREASPLGRRTLEQLVRNYEVAAAERLPVCQDSGVAVVFLEMGQDVHWTGGALNDAIHAGIREGTRTGYLRRSVTGDPTRRLKMAWEPANPDRRLRPAEANGEGGPYDVGVVHIEIVPGTGVRLTVASKGFGAENMSALRMLVPADGVQGVIDVVVDTVERAGANACPPIIAGVGIGGTFEASALLAKKAALRDLTIRNSRPDLAELESTLLDRINALGIGPQGLGGRVTALAVNIEVMPTHIAGLPVAVNLGCHSTRRMTIEL
jgi:fumarate hydratase subunit alpha